MIAKIEVQLDESVPNLTSAFRLNSVRLYNTNTSGRIVPIPGTDYVGTDMIAKKPSLPYPVTSVVGPLVYNDFSSPGIPNIAMRGAIYLFETATKNISNFLQKTCIVVGGYCGTDTQESYYRLDFFGSDGSYLDILRNHKYTCNIVAVNGRGYPTADDAYRSKSFNMEANILVWDEGDIHDIVFDNQYMLGVSRNPVELASYAQSAYDTDNILKITTDYPTGWSATICTDKAGNNPVPNDGSFWLSIDPASTSSPSGLSPDEMHLIVSANTNAVRTAYIHIKAGRLTYVVKVIQNMEYGIITVDPKDYLLPHTITSAEDYPVTVNCLTSDNITQDPNAVWTLTLTDDAWCRLATNPSTAFESASSSISGTGTTTVYLISQDNSTLYSRRTTINLNTSLSSEEAVVVLQWGRHNTGIIADNDGGGTPVSAHTYVGAFWKAGEQGERIIRIEAESNAGEWTATVMWADARWGNGDGILLSTDMLSPESLASRGISFSSNMNPDAYGSAEDYKVMGYNTTVTGSVIDGYISFRIGLRSKYTPTTQYPARYAVILLSYKNNTKYQKIFLRQGEAPDYLMHTNDPINSEGMNSSVRPAARKFSPYNLTKDGSLDAAVPLQSNGGANFTDYPTKAGALFQWAHSGQNSNDRIRYAWNPYNAAIPANWNHFGGGNSFWNTHAADNETCPPGYHRPSDGSITAFETGLNTNYSEIRQSLFKTPLTGYNYASSVSNSLWGYYADGFFDRRQVVGSASSPETKIMVSAGNRDVAYVGRLFFNSLENSDHFNASLFFPAAGMRYPDVDGYGGTLALYGRYAEYWTASLNDDPIRYGVCVRFTSSHAGTWRAEETTAMSIRCVKD